MSAAAKIAGLIKRATGLDADCLGAATLERAVQIGFRQSGLATLDDYRAYWDRRITPEESKEIAETIKRLTGSRSD